MTYSIEVVYKVSTPIFVEATNLDQAKAIAKRIGEKGASFDVLTAQIYPGGDACLFGLTIDAVEEVTED